MGEICHSGVRPAAVAGRFYPSKPGELKRVVCDYLAQARSEDDAPVPKALIVPHAGYLYSGQVAASAYARLAPARSQLRRVLLLGPAHRVAVSGIAASTAGAFATPLGEVAVDRAGVDKALTLEQVCLMDEAHAREHSLEVHLPFLQMSLETFSIVPLVVGSANYEEVLDLLDLLWGSEETLIVVSSDLSHYYDYETARRMDTETSLALEALEPDRLGDESACGRIAVGALLLAAAKRGLECTTVDLRNSGDTAGSRGEVVGYGSYAFT